MIQMRRQRLIERLSGIKPNIQCLHIGFIAALALSATLLSSCAGRPANAERVHSPAPIYPEYDSITVPCNIAPLNFMVHDADAVYVVVRGMNDSIVASGSDARFDADRWHDLLQANAGHDLSVSVMARKQGRWTEYDSLVWTVSADTIDRYLSYRLIEPGYEVWNHVSLCQRDLSTFEETTIIDNSDVDGSCLNCHISSKTRDQQMFHLRGDGGGTLVAADGKLRKLSLRNESMPAGGVYGDLHPTGRYAVFSSNVIIPGFHASGSKRLEVYDTHSDVFVVDMLADSMITVPWLADTAHLETFPVFSADGTSIFFCTAPALPLPDSIHSLKYSLCSVGFDALQGKIGERVDTLVNSRTNGASVCHPKASPDGQWLMYTVVDYGTFPIWHAETDMEMLHLPTMAKTDISRLNSDKSDTYHSWSANSRWVVFATKRGDGQYGKPYIAHIDSTGVASRAFVVPQQHPRHYQYTLKSYNIPDLSPCPSAFTPANVVGMRKEDAEQIM